MMKFLLAAHEESIARLGNKNKIIRQKINNRFMTCLLNELAGRDETTAA